MKQRLKHIRPRLACKTCRRIRHMKLPNIFEKEVEPLSVPAGKVIYAEGEKPTFMYVVKLGEVDLKVRGASLEVVGPDGFFGEGALVDQGDRLATAVAKTDCVLIPISEKHFIYMLEEIPLFALTVMRKMAERWRTYSASGMR
jgi:CRP/FNR family transcriptional regulator, cyclic AMP receptor protein